MASLTPPDARAAFLATMYDHAPEPAGPGQPDATKPASGPATSRVVTVGAVRYEVPDPAYVAALERRLADQERTIGQLHQDVHRLARLVSLSRAGQQRQGRGMAELRRELDRKISRRDSATLD